MADRHFDVLIIGAGISGISAAYYLQEFNHSKTYKILEARETLGGTWDLFKYPGIRSDSDMYTLGFEFKPWVSRKAIADGPSIMSYLHETVAEFGIDKNIIFNQKMMKASWSSELATWTIDVQDKKTNITESYTCNFLSMCCGYYNYDNGYTPDFKGIEEYKGRVVHPQKWTDDIVHKDKKVIVIGSGATAVTLVPEMAKEAKHVTMLQRSPTYIVTAPSEDKISNLMNRILPKKIAYNISRWRKISFQKFTYNLCKKYPKFMKGIMVKGVKKELGEEHDIEKNFTPNYNPWDQRVCLVPDGDLFESLKKGTSSVVTDHIDRFTEKGILLQSGKELEADLIVTATGLQLVIMGDIPFYKDNEKIDFSNTVSYKGTMFSNVPNVALAFGYTNASWTLKCDLTNRFVSRILNYMDEHNYKYCVPTQDDPNMEMVPFLDFSSGYIQRFLDRLPKSGSKMPWKLEQSYFHDRKMIKNSPIDDGFLTFVK